MPPKPGTVLLANAEASLKRLLPIGVPPGEQAYLLTVLESAFHLFFATFVERTPGTVLFVLRFLGERLQRAGCPIIRRLLDVLAEEVDSLGTLGAVRVL